MEEVDIETEIYFGNDRYLMKNWYYESEATFCEGAESRGWEVKLYNANDSSDEIMEFFSWWYWDPVYGLSDQGENEEFLIINPHSNAVKELLRILEVGIYGKDHNPLNTLYRQVYKSSGEALSILSQLKTAILNAQEQRDLLLVSLNNPPR
jgi:hypothetical protein|tara:strand:+ start:79 stop:531 length:453 start_codon:yes stop_codon:yes gene_type:complete